MNGWLTQYGWNRKKGGKFVKKIYEWKMINDFKR